MKVMIAEDEFLVALMLEQDLRDNGYDVVGPFTNIDAARQAAGQEAFDVAVLDINMAGQMAFPVADELKRRGLPYLFLSGYGRAKLPEEHQAASCLPKPYELTTLLRELRRATTPA
jgi:DNA-binding response OmpR family regulator